MRRREWGLFTCSPHTQRLNIRPPAPGGAAAEALCRADPRGPRSRGWRRVCVVLSPEAVSRGGSQVCPRHLSAFHSQPGPVTAGPCTEKCAPRPSDRGSPELRSSPGPSPSWVCVCVFSGTRPSPSIQVWLATSSACPLMGATNGSNGACGCGNVGDPALSFPGVRLHHVTWGVLTRRRGRCVCRGRGQGLGRAAGPELSGWESGPVPDRPAPFSASSPPKHPDPGWDVSTRVVFENISEPGVGGYRAALVRPHPRMSSGTSSPGRKGCCGPAFRRGSGRARSGRV